MKCGYIGNLDFYSFRNDGHIKRTSRTLNDRFAPSGFTPSKRPEEKCNRHTSKYIDEESLRIAREEIKTLCKKIHDKTLICTLLSSATLGACVTIYLKVNHK